MNSGAHVAITLAATAVAVTSGAWIVDRVRSWRRKSPAELERLRRLDVNRRGRIAAGHVVDLIESARAGTASCLVVYKYEVAGVEYEVAQDVSTLPRIFAAAHAFAGLTASVKYDPKRPTNSIIACEEWSGIPELVH
ncbi:MAG: hypothetical protein HYS33_05425 [Acidobacteria bacterium]|nr:hypothetical protein [Acidobacteriota bacterium]